MSRGGWVALLLLAACHGAAPAPVAVVPPAPLAPPDAGPPVVDAPAPAPTPILDAYRATADQIIAHARADRGDERLHVVSEVAVVLLVFAERIVRVHAQLLRPAAWDAAISINDVWSINNNICCMIMQSVTSINQV